MKIINNREDEMLHFRDLAHGEVFLDGDYETCMVLSEDVTTDNNHAANAVGLGNGRLRWFDEGDQVYKVNAELTIT